MKILRPSRVHPPTLWICFLALGCSSSTSPGQELEGFDASALQAAIQTASEVPGMRSLLVARHGELVSENYFNGIGPDSAQDVRSVTKSFTSALIGIAIREGFIEGTHQTLGTLLASAAPDMRPEWAAVTLAEATSMGAEAFAEEYLFGPLGMGNREWIQDSRGYAYGGVALFLTARDMVAFGQLFLDGGVRDGVQVVPADWVQSSTRPQTSTGYAVPHSVTLIG